MISNKIISLVMHENSYSTLILKNYCPKDKLVEIVHGVPDIINKKFVSDVKKDSFIILIFGAIRIGKSYEESIELMNIIHNNPKYEDVKLIIAGKTVDEYVEKRLIKEINNSLNKNNIILINKYISNEELKNLFNIASLLLLIYSRRVGPSGVFANSIKYRLPVIINIDNKYITTESDIPCIKININKKNVIYDVIKTIDKIRSGNIHYKNLLNEIQTYATKYSYSNQSKKYIDVYTNLINY